MPFEVSKESESDAILLLKSRLSKFESEEGRLKGFSYQPRANDVAISTSPKAGTTWLQQICHQMRAAEKGGDMSFEEITEVVPWLELAYDQGQDLESPQYGEEEGKPRFFKTHAWEKDCPPFPKTIVVFRDPCDVLFSFYKFFEGWFFEPGTVSLEAFAEEFWLARGVPPTPMQNASYFVHLISWYERRNDPSVLILFFEDLKDDLEHQISRLAKFLSTEHCNFDSPEIISTVEKMSTFSFMKDHAYHFDEKLSKSTRNEVCGLPKDAGMAKSKIVRGDSGLANSKLPEKLAGKVLEKWREVVEPVTGCKTYSELRASLNTHQ